jgi:uncharacterized protein DUF4232
MSDERFDQDLRAVLLEEAPYDVPDELRRRIAAVSSSEPESMRPMPTWQRPAVRWGVALAAAVVVVLVGVWQFRPAPETGVGTDPSASPSGVPATSTTAAASAQSSSSPSAVPDVAACLAVDLDGQILGWQGAAGSRIADIRVSNKGARPCTIQGTPRLELVDATRRVLIDSMAAGASGDAHVSPTDERFELAPGDRLRTEVQVSNYCGEAPVPPIDVAFDLPAGGGHLVAAPGPGVSSSEALPPCLGSAPSSISTNGWRR